MKHYLRTSALCVVTLSLFACERKHDDDSRQPVLPAASPQPPSPLSPAVTAIRQLTEAVKPEPKDDKQKPKDALEEADSDMREVLEQLAALGGKPIASLTPAEARKQPSPRTP